MTLDLDQIIQENFICYPNPSNQIIYLKADKNYHISLYAKDGKLVYQKEISSGLNVIDLTEFSKGIYSLHYQN